MLNIKNLYKYYKVAANALFNGSNKQALKANETLSFEAHKSKTLANVGDLGCGRSTFAKVLMGLETATEGEILFKGQILKAYPLRTEIPKSLLMYRWCLKIPSTR